MGGFTLCETHLAKTRRIKKHWQTVTGAVDTWTMRRKYLGISMDVCRRMSKAYSDRYTHEDEKTKKIYNESHIDTTMKMYHAPACVLLHRHACDCGCMHPWSYTCAGGRVTLCSAMSLPLSCMWTLSSFANCGHLLPTSTWISMDFNTKTAERQATRHEINNFLYQSIDLLRPRRLEYARESETPK